MAAVLTQDDEQQLTGTAQETMWAQASAVEAVAGAEPVHEDADVLDLEGRWRRRSPRVEVTDNESSHPMDLLPVERAADEGLGHSTSLGLQKQSL